MNIVNEKTPDQSDQVLFLEELNSELGNLLSESNFEADNLKDSEPTALGKFLSLLYTNKKRDSDCSHHDFNPLYFCILPLKDMTSQELTSLKEQLREKVKQLENTEYSLNNFRIMPKTEAYQEMANKGIQIYKKEYRGNELDELYGATLVNGIFYTLVFFVGWSNFYADYYSDSKS